MKFEELMNLLDSMTEEQKDQLSEKLWSIMNLNHELDTIQDEMKRHIRDSLNSIRVSVDVG